MLKLRFIAGPLGGTDVTLEAGTLTVGRHRSNGLRIVDSSISREQLLLEVQGETFRVRNLSTKVPLLLNDRVVTEAMVSVGDEVLFGSNRARLVAVTELEDGDDGDTAPVAVQGHLETQTDDYPRHPAWNSSSEPAGRASRDRDLLYKISYQLARATSEDELRQSLVSLIAGGTGASRVGLFLKTATGKRVSLVASSGDGSRYSSTALNQSVRDRRSLLCEEVARDDGLAAQDSVMAGDIRSIIVVPLVIEDAVHGALYLHRSREQPQFTPSDLALATSLANQASLTLLNLRRHSTVARAHTSLARVLKDESEMIATSPSMGAVMRLLTRAAPSDATVLLRGESGTGKELAASFTHFQSGRAAGPFVAINCAAIPTELIESELFGHARGAFAGAVENREGRFQQADGGTLFLDEIGEMQVGCQVKLLRVLETREFSQVGSNRTISVNVRIVAGTNRDLEEAVRGGTFRGDLYFRLRVVEVFLPALRERVEDIPAMVERFVGRFNGAQGKRVTEVSPAALERLRTYHWPGNVRELKNAIESAMIVAEGSRMEAADLPHYLLPPAYAPPRVTEQRGAPDPMAGNYPVDFGTACKEFERRWLTLHLERNGGNIARTSREIGLSRMSLHRKITDLKIVLPGRR